MNISFKYADKGILILYENSSIEKHEDYRKRHTTSFIDDKGRVVSQSSRLMCIVRK